MRRITIKDLATYLQFSVSTVSRALADDKNVRRETRERVLEAARELGYRRNIFASRLRGGGMGVHSVGVVVSEMLTPFAGRVLEGIQAVLQSEGIPVMVANSHDDPAQELRNIQMMRNQMVDGLIIGPCCSDDNVAHFRAMVDSGFPMVFFSRSICGLETSRVVMNDYDKAFYLVDYLISSGRRNIVHLRGPEVAANYTEIYRAYCDALERHHILFDPVLVIPVTLTAGEGHRVADMLIGMSYRFDAIFACNDLVAIGVMNRLRDHGLRVPEDVAVAGFSGSPLSQLVYPALTTVVPQHQQMGEEAAVMLLDLIRTQGRGPREVVVDSEIKLRGSTHSDRSASPLPDGCP